MADNSDPAGLDDLPGLPGPATVRDPAGLETVHLLRAVTVEFGLRQAEFAQLHGIHPTDLRALVCLLDAGRAGEPATAGLLGARLGLNSAGTTGVIDRLEGLGLVSRTRDPQDRRRVLVRVEERAVRLGWEFFGPLIDGTLTALDGLDGAGREAVRRFLAGALEVFASPPATDGS
ncbi:MarR family transcriptional regulator [Streptomyces sp. NPDC097619]|uniref:MarR family winged helix-turn-helix transcriptional regulator n=1 Tax=Streptomyces sp. NPDC097619 TaxID=3157228 RepID=UPI00332C4CA7